MWTVTVEMVDSRVQACVRERPAGLPRVTGVVGTSGW